MSSTARILVYRHEIRALLISDWYIMLIKPPSLTSFCAYETMNRTLQHTEALCCAGGAARRRPAPVAAGHGTLLIVEI